MSNYNLSYDEDMGSIPMPGPPLYNGIKLGLFTGLYTLVLVVGVCGNILTSLVIVKTRDLHSNTNFFLCNLACSDLILLLSGIPFDVLYIWRPYPAFAGTWFCILKGKFLITMFQNVRFWSKRLVFFSCKASFGFFPKV